MAEAPVFELGDTIRLLATFRDWAPEGTTGAVVDPSANDGVFVTIYNEDGASINSYEYGVDPEVEKVEAVDAALETPPRDGPYFFFDFVIPTSGTSYTLEFKGIMDSEPTLIRQKVKVKFDVKELGL